MKEVFALKAFLPSLFLLGHIPLCCLSFRCCSHALFSFLWHRLWLWLLLLGARGQSIMMLEAFDMVDLLGERAREAVSKPVQRIRAKAPLKQRTRAKAPPKRTYNEQSQRD